MPTGRGYSALIACPTGGLEVAHRIINTAATIRCLALSTRSSIPSSERPQCACRSAASLTRS